MASYSSQPTFCFFVCSIPSSFHIIAVVGMLDAVVSNECVDQYCHFPFFDGVSMHLWSFNHCSLANFFIFELWVKECD